MGDPISLAGGGWGEAEHDRGRLFDHRQHARGSLGTVRDKHPKKRLDFLIVWHTGLFLSLPFGSHLIKRLMTMLCGPRF